ncbi:hypothetical protein ACI3EY_01550 [Ornithinimicrobium sp. LYQ92]
MPARQHAAVAVAALLLTIGDRAPADAACAGPQTEVIPMVAAPGDTVTVRGTAFGTECNDAGSHTEDGFLGPPATDITVTFQQESRTWLVARGDAHDDEGRTFTAVVEVPRDALLGTVTVVTEPPSYSENRPPGGTGDPPTTFVVMGQALPSTVGDVSAVTFLPPPPALLAVRDRLSRIFSLTDVRERRTGSTGTPLPASVATTLPGCPGPAAAR